jgi:hypothetical protein
MKLPGVCKGCGLPVVWTGKRWRNPGQRSGHHACKPDGFIICGAFMPQAKERCARRLGHTDHHSTRYAMDNAARSRRRWVPVAA